MSSDVEIVIKGRDASATSFASATAKAEVFKQDVSKKLDALNAKKVKINADIASATAKVDELKSKTEQKISAVNAREMKINADIRQALLKIEELRKSTGGVATQKVDADISSAEAKVATLRAQLDRAGAARLRIDADTAGAEARVEALRRAAKALDGEEVRIRAEARTEGANSKLDNTKRKADSLDGKNPLVRVSANVGGALKAIAIVEAALAAVSAGMAGLGLAAGLGAVAAGGMGVLAGGLSGIGGAVSALGKHTASAGGSAGGAAQQQTQMAAALDQVKQAQYGLTVAQRDAAQAQVDLNTARDDAAKKLRDLQLQTEDMALSERQASLDVIQAKQDLDKTMASRTATDLQRKQAQLFYDESLQHQKDLKAQAEDLAKTKATADQQGVAGAQSVIDAQNKVKDSQERVREAAYQVVAAQAAVRQASVSAGGGGGAAFNALAQAMANLSPAGQKFARFLRGFIDGPLKELRFSAQTGLLPGLQSGLEKLGPVIHSISPAFEQFAGIIGKVLGGGIAGLGSMAPALLKFATTALQALSPLQGTFQRFGDSFKAMVDRVVKNGDLAGAMKGLADIVDVLVKNLPGLIEDGLKLAKALGPELAKAVDTLLPLLRNLAKAMGPLLVDALKVVTPLLKKLSDWIEAHPDAFRKLAVGVLATALAMKVLGPAANAAGTALSGLQAALAAGPIGLIAVAVLALGAALIYGYQHVKPVRDALDAVGKVVMPMLQSALGQVKDSIDALVNSGVPWQQLFEILGVLIGTVVVAALFMLAAQIRVVALAAEVLVAAFRIVGKVILDVVLKMLQGFRRVLEVLAKMPGPLGDPFRKMLTAVDGAIAGVKLLQSALDNVQSKVVDVTVTVNGTPVNVRDSGNQVTMTSHGPGGSRRTTKAFEHGGIVGAAATGGLRSGLTMVGEHGRELVSLAPGSQVHSNPDTERLLSGSGGSGGGRLVLEVRGDDSRLSEWMVEALRRAVRVRGGDVQLTLGRA